MSYTEINKVVSQWLLTFNLCVSVTWPLTCAFHIPCTHTPEIIDMHSGVCDKTPGFNRLGEDKGKTRRESFKFWDLVRLVLESLRYYKMQENIMVSSNRRLGKPCVLWCTHEDHVISGLNIRTKWIQFGNTDSSHAFTWIIADVHLNNCCSRAVISYIWEYNTIAYYWLLWDRYHFMIWITGNSLQNGGTWCI